MIGHRGNPSSIRRKALRFSVLPNLAGYACYLLSPNRKATVHVGTLRFAHAMLADFLHLVKAMRTITHQDHNPQLLK